MTEEEIRKKLESLTPEQIHALICRALDSAGVPYTVGGGTIDFTPLDPADYEEWIRQIPHGAEWSAEGESV